MIQQNLLHIGYPSGEMNIVIDKFFPTTVERANKVFQLVRDHEPLDALTLYRCLEGLARDYSGLIDHYSDEMDHACDNAAYEEAYKEHRYCLRKYEQAKRNMRDLKKIAKLEV